MTLREESYDIAILGAGFAGSLLAAVTARQGRSVVLLERGQHPRFAIGESSTPLSNLFLEELGKRYDLPAVAQLAKWGTWQESLPHLACGLKRGFSFFHHDVNFHEKAPEQMFVAASPHDAIADTHWFRADFDHFLMEQAKSVGVQYYDHFDLRRVDELEDSVLLQGSCKDELLAVRARFVVDATGPRGSLHRCLQLRESPLPDYPRTEALFSHFTNVRRLDSFVDLQSSYPAEDAAVHHVFDGGWAWVLRFNNGVTSAGVAGTEGFARDLRMEEGRPAWEQLLLRVPWLREQFRDAEPLREFTHLKRLSFQSAKIAGARWALLPSAAGFVDPLLSTGFPLTLFGVSRLSSMLDEHWASQEFGASLSAYSAATHAELLQASSLISALYANMHNFAAFRAILLIYFAAASYAESARRLGRPDLATSFLLHDHAQFGSESRRLLAWAKKGIIRDETAAYIQAVRTSIAPFDIAGLTSQVAGFDYPCDAQDLIDNAWKLQSTALDVQQMLERSGFYGH